ncbi:MAG TPA: hypothetical protein VGN93_19015 [Shinella sp.]|jgi:hypothetical protein|uniref:hypothetical protein n=1 Tax=Shinella sp. TaxID=1870904 RepID=UPI002E0D51D7|nr:hypothetical protein [Shinella sp.]
MATGKLVVLAAFNKTDDGDLVPAFDPRQVDKEARAVREAKMLATVHAGVTAWSHDADPSIGEYARPMSIRIWSEGPLPAPRRRS